jgi:hypothetical protein
MGGPVARTIAAFTSLGTSELFQEKPFQNVTDQDRPTAGGGSPLRFGVGTSGIMPAVKEGSTLGQASSDPEYGMATPITAPTLGTPIVTPRGQTAQEEAAARRRAFEARQRLGTSTRASDQLTTTGSLG